MQLYDEQLLLEVVQDLFSKKFGDAIEVINIGECFGGVINSVYFLDCIIKDSNDTSEVSLILKVYSGKSGQERLSQIVKDFFVYHLLHEHLSSSDNNNTFTNNYNWDIHQGSDNASWFVQNRIALNKSLFPFALLWNLEYADNKDEELDTQSFLSHKTFVIMTKLEGSPLNMMRRSEPSFKHLVYTQIGELVAKIHEIIVSPCFGLIQGNTVSVTYSTNQQFVSTEMTKAIAEYKANNGDLVLAESIASYFECHKAVLNNCTTPRFCHNDIHEGNILINESKISGLIDVETALSGDPLQDLAKIFIFSTKRDHVKELAFLEGYTSANKLPQDAAQRIFVYELLVVLQMWNFHATSNHHRPDTLSSVDKFIRDLFHGGINALQNLLEQFIS